MDSPAYEGFPARMVLVCVLFILSIYILGAAILFRFGLIWSVLYLLIVLLLELRLMRGHCTDCRYYGKTCAFARGRLSALLFPKGDPDRFSRMTITAKDFVPDFLVFIVPVLAGIVLLVTGFSWLLLLEVAILLLLGFAGNGLVRGRIACRYCRQREIGCPAQRLFEKR